MKLVVTENQLEKIIMELNKNPKEYVIQGHGNDPYQYKKYGNTYFYAKKGKSPKWQQAKKKSSIDSISKKFIMFDALDSWRKTNSKLFSKYKQPKKEVKKPQPDNSWNPIKGFKGWLRRTFPNVAELFFSRDLSTDDFSDSQKLEMVKAVKNAVKRTGKKRGGIEYVDYGDNVVNDWFGHGGIKTKDMIINTLLAKPKFMVATTLGRFSYNIENGKLKITDVYDFKKIPDAKTKAKDLEGLAWPQKVDKIMRDNNVNPYVAIRHLGYLEHPEESPSSKPKINIEIPLNTTA